MTNSKQPPKKVVPPSTYKEAELLRQKIKIEDEIKAEQAKKNHLKSK